MVGQNKNGGPAGLSAEDVKRLLSDPSPTARVDTAEKVATAAAGSLSATEKTIAFEIIRALSRDAEQRVRVSLSKNVKALPDLPRDVAISLAEDVADIATPILEESVVLTDADLINLIAGSDEEKQTAIARRASVSEDVSDALVATGSENVVGTLVENDGARISEQTMIGVLETFSGSERIKTGMVQRKAIPLTVAERLVTMVSEKLQAELTERHGLDKETAQNLIKQSREKTTVGLAQGADMDAVWQLVQQLKAGGRLTDTVILRAACFGNLAFVEVALATLADVPLENVQALVADPGGKGFQALYKKAGLPNGLFPAFEVAVRMSETTDYDGLEHDVERFQLRVVERVLTRVDNDKDLKLKPEDLDYLVKQIDQLQAEVAA
ncbi:MAG: DUF2336 domain-containing protein [Alphaproteobacteria bacterium]|nr:DUF2336 domain-containing protein [Alphaproteobacteria bacterium]